MRTESYATQCRSGPGVATIVRPPGIRTLQPAVWREPHQRGGTPRAEQAAQGTEGLRGHGPGLD